MGMVAMDGLGCALVIIITVYLCVSGVSEQTVGSVPRSWRDVVGGASRGSRIGVNLRVKIVNRRGRWFSAGQWMAWPGFSRETW